MATCVTYPYTPISPIEKNCTIMLVTWKIASKWQARPPPVKAPLIAFTRHCNTGSRRGPRNEGASGGDEEKRRESIKRNDGKCQQSLWSPNRLASLHRHHTQHPQRPALVVPSPPLRRQSIHTADLTRTRRAHEKATCAKTPQKYISDLRANNTPVSPTISHGPARHAYSSLISQ